jgi:hypothetical protein
MARNNLGVCCIDMSAVFERALQSQNKHHSIPTQQATRSAHMIARVDGNHAYRVKGT